MTMSLCIRGFASPETAKLLMRRAGRHQQLKMRSEQRRKLASPTERQARLARIVLYTFSCRALTHKTG